VKVKMKAYVRSDGSEFVGHLVALRARGSKPVTVYTCKNQSAKKVQTMLDAYALEMFKFLDRPVKVRAWTKEWEVADRT
jgi:hypothetical protein